MDDIMAMTKKGLMLTAVAVVLVIAATGAATAQWWGGWGFKKEDASVTAGAVPAAETEASVPPVSAQEYDVSGLLADPLKIQNFDRVMGSMSAPVTMIEYASMTCSHCADFHSEVIPLVIKEYVETGKVKYVLRDMAWDNLALGISKVARCADASQFYPLVKTFFDEQKNIVTSSSPKDEIVRVAKLAGFDEAKVNACVKDEPLHKLVLAMKDSGFKAGVKGTPTSFVNGTPIDGALPWKDVKAVLDAEVAKAAGK